MTAPADALGPRHDGLRLLDPGARFRAVFAIAVVADG